MQRAFILDTNICTGCGECRIACALENGLAPAASWRRIETFNASNLPGIPAFHLSLACNHCVRPPCLEHCPALAYTKSEATGEVTIDAQLCIGCKYCTWACPYDALRFDAAAGVVGKCTFCNHRVDGGERPACVMQCPTGALQLVDLEAMERAASETRVPGFPRTDAEPAIRFVPLRGGRQGPEMSTPPPAAPLFPPSEAAGKVSLRSEWPLVGFSLLTALLVGMIGLPGSVPPVGLSLFLVLAAVAVVLSSAHLGRKLRALRSLANWRRSWLSREIILFCSFVALSALHLAADRPGAITGWPALLAGTATLIAIDNVYRVTRTPHLGSHSARVLFTGALALGIVSGSAGLILIAGTAKLILYVRRHWWLERAERATHPAIRSLRLLFGLLVPAGLGFSGVSGLGALAIACVAVGEIVDRCEYYVGLDVPSPRKQLRADLAAAVARRGRELMAG